MSKNECGKSRNVDNPYEVWRTPDGGWEWKVLKKYQNPENEANNPYARWSCAVSSPITRSQTACGYECGDVYVTDVTQDARRVK